MRIVVRDLSIVVGGRLLVEHVEFAVEPGQLVALVGPSGTGKTSLLFALAGHLRGANGSCEVWFDDGTRRSIQPTDVAWVTQGSHAIIHRSVLDNVALGCLAQGLTMKEARKKALDAIEAVGLSGRVHQAARHLSGGELQRTSIARALVSRRPLVLADEPTGHLDSTNTAAVAKTLRQAVNQDGACCLIATHDLGVAEGCNSVVDLADFVPHQ